MLGVSDYCRYGRPKLGEGLEIMIKSALVLLVVLVAYWLMLSGYLHKPVLLIMGVISILVVLGLSLRMKILDRETAPYMNVKVLGYFVWLFKEITKSNLVVIKAVLSPNMEISPKITKVPMKQSTDLGRVTFANSITLTPGTIAVEMCEDKIIVHALLAKMATASGFKEMGERAGRAVNDPMQDNVEQGDEGIAKRGKS